MPPTLFALPQGNSVLWTCSVTDVAVLRPDGRTDAFGPLRTPGPAFDAAMRLQESGHPLHAVGKWPPALKQKPIQSLRYEKASTLRRTLTTGRQAWTTSSIAVIHRGSNLFFRFVMPKREGDGQTATLLSRTSGAVARLTRSVSFRSPI